MKQKKQQRLRGTQFTPRESCVTPNRDRGQVKPHGHKRLFKFDELSAQRLTSPETKVTTPAGKGHACCLCDMLQCKQFEQRRKGSLWWFGTALQVGSADFKDSQRTAGTAGLHKKG